MFGALVSTWDTHRGLDRALLLILALFPLVAVSVPSGGSTLYLLLALIGLYHARGSWSILEAEERHWLLALLALFLLATLSLLYTTELENGVQRLERFLRLASIGLIYPLLLRRGVSPGPWLLFSLSLAALVMAGQAVYEKLYLGQRFADGLYHKIVFGDMAALFAVLLSLAALSVVRGRLWRGLLLLAVMACLYAVLMSATRAAWLFLLIAPLYLLWLHRHRWSRRLQLGLALLPLALIAVLAIWQPRAVMAPLQDGVSDLQEFLERPEVGSSWGARLVMWRNALQIAAEHPLMGTGLGDFNHDSRQLIEEGRSYRYVAIFQHAHSIYFDTLATLGGLGLLLLILALFWLPYRLLSRAWYGQPEGWQRYYTLAGLVCVMAFALFGLFEGWLTRNPFVNAYVVYLSLFIAAAMGSGRRSGTPVK